VIRQVFTEREGVLKSALFSDPVRLGDGQVDVTDTRCFGRALNLDEAVSRITFHDAHNGNTDRRGWCDTLTMRLLLVEQL
jgi:hypothetical protein